MRVTYRTVMSMKRTAVKNGAFSHIPLPVRTSWYNQYPVVARNKKRIERYSRQKEEIYRILKDTNIHPIAEWIYKKAKRKIPRLSLGTVYRNLNQLHQKGAIKKFTFGSPLEHFDGNITPHQHFICKRCGKIYDLFLDLEKEIRIKTKKVMKFRVQEIEVEFYGTCSNCL